MFDKIIGLVVIYIVFNACVETNKNCSAPVQSTPVVKQEEKIAEPIATVKTIEVVVQTVPKEYISDCMMHLKYTEEECKKSWNMQEQI